MQAQESRFSNTILSTLTSEVSFDCQKEILCRPTTVSPCSLMTRDSTCPSMRRTREIATSEKQQEQVQHHRRCLHREVEEVAAAAVKRRLSFGQLQVHMRTRQDSSRGHTVGATHRGSLGPARSRRTTQARRRWGIPIQNQLDDQILKQLPVFWKALATLSSGVGI